MKITGNIFTFKLCKKLMYGRFAHKTSLSGSPTFHLMPKTNCHVQRLQTTPE